MNTIQKVIGITIIFFMAFQVGMAQKKVDHILRKYKNDKGVMALDLSGDFSSMTSDRDLMSKIDKLNVLVFNEEAEISDKDQKKIRNSLNGLGYEKLIKAKNKEGHLTLYVIEQGEYITHLYAEANAFGKRVFMTLEGEVIYDELRKFNFDFEGGDIFKNLQD